MNAQQLNPAQIMTMINQINGHLADRGLSKAVGTSSAGDGTTLVRQDLSATLVMMVPTQTPLRNILKRYPGNGNAHSFYRLEPTNTAQGKFIGTSPLNGFFPKGGLPNPSNGNFKLVAIPYSNLGDVATVTFQDQAQGRSYTDIRQQQMLQKMLNVGMMEEWAIINGDSDTTGGLVWDGLYKQINTQGGQVFVSPDGKALAGYVREVQYFQTEAGGNPDTLVMDGMGQAVITTNIIQYLYGIRQNGGEALTDISAGISMKAYDFGYGPCNFVRSRYINPNKYTGQSFMMSLDTSTMDGQNMEGSNICMIDVDPMHSVDLAIVRTAWPTLVYETSALQVTAPAWQGMVTGISYAGQTPFSSVN